MRHLSSVLWLLPLAVHIGYVLATFSHLPGSIGQDATDTGTPLSNFIVEWFLIIGICNAVFAFVHIRLPHFSDRMLSVPGKEHWLSSEEHRNDLVDRLRGIFEASLLCLNVFFLAVYQSIYQANVTTPVFSVPFYVLVFFFMMVPFLVIVVAIMLTVRQLAADAKKTHSGNNS